MNYIVGDLLLLVSDLGTIAFVAIAIGQILRFAPQPAVQQVALGILVALVTMFSILNHSYVPHSLPSDVQTIYLGFVMAFVGWPAALISLVLVTVFKFHQALDVAPLALGSAVLGLLAGGLWRMAMRKLTRSTFPALLGFGVLVAIAAMPAQLAAPNLAALTLVNIVLSFLLNVLVGISFGALIERERILIFGEQQLRRDANTDELTGLQNRRTLAAAFEASNFGSRVGRGLLLIDIDNFKSINDAHGHAAGDQVLRHIAAIMQQSVRSGDLLVRYGGEEFAILIVANDVSEAIAAGERIRSAVERSRVSLGQLSIAVTVSVGLSWWVGRANRGAQIELADAALYQAKRNGRNRVAVRSESTLNAAEDYYGASTT